jgi:hypothetical protein
MRPEPVVIDKVFEDDIFIPFQKFLFDTKKEEHMYDSVFGRYAFINSEIEKHAEMLLPVARSLFKSQTLLPTYGLFAHYKGPSANLFKHKDKNACTYTIDMCVYQDEPWDLYVEDKAYTLEPNQALAYYGEDQEHWREKFPNPDTQNVAMIFFHYVEPDHWYFTKGPEYYQVKFGIMTEEQYTAIYNK